MMPVLADAEGKPRPLGAGLVSRACGLAGPDSQKEIPEPAGFLQMRRVR